ncbi:hypothetical protein [Fluviicola taffensis]|uniref:Uncharacterized protein n=1 Tax=Fluviicola taffensis (strain DSM 16823 / NCIMB 13979 / RW262) TaxID=755732 RepID=F2I9B4_FLUTR|nr:hypothetical protein [Fluviicola taffensis]AEA44071.1 hypothetical protein Fluta_2085 [Fluviicola taffensis DSM 16823]
MKNQFAVLFVFLLCISLQGICAQETPTLAAFSLSQKSKENSLEVKTSEPIMAVWAQDPVNHPKNNNLIHVVPELALEKVEKKKNTSGEN